MKTAEGSKSARASGGVRKRRVRTTHSASEKCRAVLSVWSERRKPAQVCREMGIRWSVFSQWQHRAMEGMLAALEPPRTKGALPEAALGERLTKLLERKASRRAGKIEKPLAAIPSEPVPEAGTEG